MGLAQIPIKILGLHLILNHRGPNGNSTLDHIWLNCPWREVECKVLRNLNSDHEMIMVRMRGSNLSTKEGGNRGRLWGNYSKENPASVSQREF